MNDLKDSLHNNFTTIMITVYYPLFIGAAFSWEFLLLLANTNLIYFIIFSSTKWTSAAKLNFLNTWNLRCPRGTLTVSPSICHTSEERLNRNSAEFNAISARFLLLLPLKYFGRNHSRKSASKRLPLSACAIVLISCGTAQMGTLL